MKHFRTILTTAAALLVGLCLLVAPGYAQVRPSIAGLQTQITTLQSQVASGTIPNVAGYVTMDISTPSRPQLRVSGANLQVVNGTGSSSTPNGLGNLIVGYDEVRPAGTSAECSLGEFTSVTGCFVGGGLWLVDHKSGSHNVVIGPWHNYSKTGGQAVGSFNTINGNHAFAAGRENVASGTAASVTGGQGNTAFANYSSVSAGQGNTASAQYSSVSGGLENTASDAYSSVSAGQANTASGDFSSVSGGEGNTASGGWSSISGGNFITVSTDHGWDSQ